MKKIKIILSLSLLIVSQTSSAHDPIFGIGPHVLFKQGIETSLQINTDKSGKDLAITPSLNLTYGLTGDWAAGIEVPYAFKDQNNQDSRGFSDISAFTKYRFWRKDSLGLQESAAVFLKIKSSTGDEAKSPKLGTGTTDNIVGLTYGYEGRKKYRWASVRYRNNGRTDSGLHRGDKVLIDFVGGIRPKLTSYTEPDTVWLLELNGELSQKADLNGAELSKTGGNQWFISPGVFWTKRNFAIKAGVQIPVSNNLNGVQKQDDYRGRITFEWHQ